MNGEAGILRALSSYREEMAEFARRLIAVPTENPPGREYDACVEVIAGELRRIGLPCEVLAIPPSPPAPPRSGRRAAASPSAAGGRGRAPLCPGLLENRFYAERGVPALAYGPGRLSVSHGPHELVEIGRIVDCAAIYALTALDLLGVT